MLIDEVIRLMNFDDEDKFYLVEILQRHKDIKDLDKSHNQNNRMIKYYVIRSENQLRKLYPEIKQLCELFNARAYMYLNRRSYKKVAMSMLKTLVDYSISDQFYGISHLFVSECGKNESKDGYWLLDIDGTDDESITQRISGTLTEIAPVGPKHVHTFRTRNGFHMVVRPFDTRTLDGIKSSAKAQYSAEIELKKNGMINMVVPGID